MAASSRLGVLMKLDKNQRKPRIFKASDLCTYNNTIVNSPYNTRSFHDTNISFSISANLLRCYCLQDSGNYTNCIQPNFQNVCSYRYCQSHETKSYQIKMPPLNCRRHFRAKVTKEYPKVWIPLVCGKKIIVWGRWFVSSSLFWSMWIS